MSMYDELPLDEIIKFYAATIAAEGMDVARIELHQALCKRLGVLYEKFRPFEDEEIRSSLTETQAERLLRKAIRGLKETA